MGGNYGILEQRRMQVWPFSDGMRFDYSVMGHACSPSPVSRMILMASLARRCCGADGGGPIHSYPQHLSAYLLDSSLVMACHNSHMHVFYCTYSIEQAVNVLSGVPSGCCPDAFIGSIFSGADFCHRQICTCKMQNAHANAKA